MSSPRIAVVDRMRSAADPLVASPDTARASTITIAIPTFNRGRKAARLIEALTRQIVDAGATDRIELLVSDNHSRIDPAADLAPLLHGPVRTRFVRQERNLGFDGNIEYLYAQATTDFVWYFGDDDLPLPGAIARVLAVLAADDPDVLLYSFKQPPDLATPQFDYPVSPYVTADPAEQAERVMYYSKLSIYVLRRVALSPGQKAEIARQAGDGWMFIVLALSVLEAVPAPRVAMLREFLASSDDDWHALEWTPTPFLRMHRPAEHPFVRRHRPALSAERRALGLQSAIGICFYVMAGIYAVHDVAAYRTFIAELPWQPRLLVRIPRAMLQFLLLKGRLWPVYGPLLRWTQRRRQAAPSPEV